MTRWKDTLPESMEADPQSWFDEALTGLAFALWAQARGDQGQMLDSAAWAAAEIRAWRKSLPWQGDRIDDYSPKSYDDRGLLSSAAHHVLYADESDGLQASYYLRRAEAALRTLWRRHQEAAR